MNTPYLFTSERLGFRNWRPDDISGMASINANAEVMEFFPATQGRQQTAAFIQRMRELYAERGFCYFAVETLEEKDFIGFIGLAWAAYPASFTPCVDIGWRLKREAWGKGYATEGAKRCLAFAFNDLGLEKVIAVAPLLNTKSIKVMEQAGMQSLLQFKHPALANHPALEPCAAYVATRAWTTSDLRL